MHLSLTESICKVAVEGVDSLHYFFPSSLDADSLQPAADKNHLGSLQCPAQEAPSRARHDDREGVSAWGRGRYNIHSK